jgi:ATP-dependent RNA helicase SUPV3L1/SUV3
VRFGAYHLYLPLLLKPAPRVLATQLFALKHEGPESKGFEAIERLAASGRTSIPADKEVAPVLYRTAGYRVCGERAVRVDILERLADVIRPALAWRASFPGVKPAAAFDGGGFTVTVAMTSLTGCSGEEFASILRSLGYRMEQRPKPAAPPPPAPEVAATEPAPAEGMPSEVTSTEVLLAETAPANADPSPTLGQEPDTTVQDSVAAAPEPTTPAEPAKSADPVADTETAFAGGHEQPAVEPVSSTIEELASVPEVASAEPALQADPTAGPPAQTAPEESAQAATTPAAAPEPPEVVEVWRPGRADGPRHHRPQRAREDSRRREPRPAHAQAPADAATSTGEGAPAVAAEGVPVGEERKRARRRRRPDRSDRPAQAAPQAPAESPDRPPQVDSPVQAERPVHTERPDRPPRVDRPGPPRGDRFNRPQRGDRPDRPGRRDRDSPDRDPDLRAKYIKGRTDRDRRDKAPDPNSPFAKLAALKEQLEADAKERR